MTAHSRLGDDGWSIDWQPELDPLQLEVGGPARVEEIEVHIDGHLLFRGVNDLDSGETSGNSRFRLVPVTGEVWSVRGDPRQSLASLADEGGGRIDLELTDEGGRISTVTIGRVEMESVSLSRFDPPRLHPIGAPSPGSGPVREEVTP
jgi:hypothetical protein